MKEFNVGDEFVYCPDERTCFCKIKEIKRWDDEEQGGKCGMISYERYIYKHNSCEAVKHEESAAEIFRDEIEDKEYVQIDHWMTHRYCIRHVVYVE